MELAQVTNFDCTNIVFVISDSDLIRAHKYTHMASLEVLCNILKCHIAFKVCYIGKTGMVYSICYIKYVIYLNIYIYVIYVAV